MRNCWNNFINYTVIIQATEFRLNTFIVHECQLLPFRHTAHYQEVDPTQWVVHVRDNPL